MGNERKWIVVSYLVITLACAWLLNNIMLIGISYLRVRNPMVLGVLPTSAVISTVLMSIAAVIYFRQPKVEQFSNEVVQEVKKVTWPAKKATYLSTVVVVVCVLVMAIILGFYDWACAKAIGWVLGI